MIEEKFFPEIETLFKVETPLDTIENGYGYLGCVSKDKITGRIQCHICGNWFEDLSTHSRLSHKLNIEDYKKKFGLPMRCALISQRLSEIRSKTALKNMEFLSYVPNKNLLDRVRKSRKWLKSMQYARTNASFQNKKGICSNQIDNRFVIVADIVGREPTSKDLFEYDKKLYSIIKNRYITINKYRKIKGYEYKISTKEFLTKTQIIAALRKFYTLYGRTPVYKDFQKKCLSVSQRAIRTKFGSFNRAMVIAGFDI